MGFTMAKARASAYPIPGTLCTQQQMLVSICGNSLRYFCSVPQPVSSAGPCYYMQTSGTNVSRCGSLSCYMLSCITVCKDCTAKDISSSAEICNAMEQFHSSSVKYLFGTVALLFVARHHFPCV